MKVDFITENRAEKVLERELRSLQKTGNHYPKLIIKKSCKQS